MKTAMTAADAYALVSLNPAAGAVRLQRQSFVFARAWQAQGDEFSALDVLLSACQCAGPTQAQVADLMGVKQPALARAEGALASHNHAPWLN